MKRREFLQSTASVTGLTFVSCSLGMVSACAESANGEERRSVVVNGKTMRTIEIHCHSYVHDVFPLIDGKDDLGYLMPVVNTPPLRNKLDIDNVDFRLQQMDAQGIDIQALSLHVGQYHHWAERDLATEIVAIQNNKIAELWVHRSRRGYSEVVNYIRRSLANSVVRETANMVLRETSVERAPPCVRPSHLLALLQVQT